MAIHPERQGLYRCGTPLLVESTTPDLLVALWPVYWRSPVHVGKQPAGPVVVDDESKQVGAVMRQAPALQGKASLQIVAGVGGEVVESDFATTLPDLSTSICSGRSRLTFAISWLLRMHLSIEMKRRVSSSNCLIGLV